MRTTWLGWAGLLVLAACTAPEYEEDVASTDAPLLAKRLARPDRCGSWKAVELSATVDSPKPTLLPREARDAHTFCEPIGVQVPSALDAAGGDVRRTTATLSFGATRPGSRFVHEVECLYEAHTSPNLRLAGCSGGVRAGQTLVAQQFELKLWSHRRATARVALGAPASTNERLEVVGNTAELEGVTLSAPSATPFASLEVHEGLELEPHDFVASAPSGLLLAGPSLRIAVGGGKLPAGTELTVPVDEAFLATLPAGSRETLDVQQVLKVRGALELVETKPTPIVRNAAGKLSVTLEEPGFYLVTVRDLTPISNHGGPLMNGGVNAYLIWAGDFTNAASYQTQVRTFLRAIASTPWYDIAIPYGITNRRVTIAGELTLKNITSFAARDDGKQSAYMDTIDGALANGTLATDPNGLYFVLGAPGVSETGPWGSFCSEYCGYHSHRTVGSTIVKWAFVGYPDVCTSCDAPESTPHGKAVDGALSVIAHELIEAVTDPEGSAWYGAAESEGYASHVENADKCAWIYPSRQGAGTDASPAFNLTIGSERYLIQGNWVLDGEGYCGMGVESVSITAAPLFAGLVINEVGRFHVRVTNDGPVQLDAGRLAVVGRPEGPRAGDPVPVAIPSALAPGQSAEVEVAVQAPYEIAGNVASVPFVFSVRDAASAHIFSARSVVPIDVRRADLLIDQSACEGVSMPNPVDVFTWFQATASFRNVGSTVWTASDYKLVALPLDVSFDYIQLPQALPRDVPPGDRVSVTFSAYAPYSLEGEKLEFGVGVANGASVFQVGCPASTQVKCVANVNTACAPCGTIQCNGDCVSTYANEGNPCGCGGRYQCGACSKPLPADYDQLVVRDYHVQFAWPVSDFTRTYGAEAGYEFVSCTLTRESGGGRCLLQPSYEGAESLTATFGNNLTEGARCTVHMTQRRVCD